MNRVFALVALATALTGCQSMQRSVFGPAPAPTRTTTVSAPIVTSPATPPVIVQPAASSYTYTQPPAQPVYTPTQYTPAPAYQPQGQPLDLSSRPLDLGQRTLLDADRSFSELVIQRGLAAAVSSVADPEGTMLITTNTAGTVNLIPEKATLASSQDFGQTTGRFVQVLAGGTAIQGRYVTVWRKTAGNWRVLSYASMVSAPRPAATTPARRR